MNPDAFDFANQSGLQRIAATWSSLFCAEHDGSIAAFERLTMQLDEIEEFHKLFDNRKRNYAKMTARATGGVALAALVAASMATGGASGVATALGRAGLLGAASTGTAITSLSGAALTSLSLAALGGGTMAAGTVVVTAAGAALGSVIGGVISNRYAGDIREFGIQKQNEGGDRSILFTNGFLCAKKDSCVEWKRGLRGRFDDANWYFIKWESSSKHAIGRYLSGATGQMVTATFVKGLARAGSKKFGQVLNPYAMIGTVLGATANDWHVSMVKAMKTGALLADIIARAPQKHYILMGHSLGARAIYYALLALSTRTAPVVDTVYLLGGAVGRTDTSGWEQAARALQPGGRIYNCYSQNAKVLGVLYRAANAGLSDPIGIGPVTARSSTIFNVDCSNLIGGHNEWKERLADVFEVVAANDTPPGLAKV